ncbi:MAG TPA: pilus assembly protein, partial [Rhodospirillaceae bacterium]|nr:pilus assembly protein [Rhodospirillaceae bacterium]
YDVRSYNSFAAANTAWTPAFDIHGNPTNNCFDTGGSGGIVTIRVAYNYSFITPGLGYFLGSGVNNGVAFVYTVIIQNEPF